MTREQIVSSVLLECRSWIGTPYIHQASFKGVGVDCLGLVRGVWRHLYGAEPETVPAYSPDWGEASDTETILDAAHRNFIEIHTAAKPADLLVFRWREGVIAKHVGILADNKKFMHAYEGAGVVETSLSLHWQKRIVGIFRFPILPAIKENK